MDDETIDVRLAALERTNRRLRRWLVGVTILLVLAVVFEGVSLWARPLGIYRDTSGRMRIAVQSAGEGAYLFVWNARRQERLHLGVNREGLPALGLLGPDKQARIFLMVDEDKTSSLALSGPDPKRDAILLDVDAQGRPRLRLDAPEGKGMILLGFHRDGNPALILTDRDGAVLFRTPAAGAAR